MATSKFDRELRFIERDSKRLSSEIEALAQEIPDDPAGAAEKEKKISEMQESLSHLLRRKKEILDSLFPLLGRMLEDPEREDTVKA